MNGQIDQLVRSLLHKDSLDQCSLQELEQFASRHPYFGAAQLLLTKKLQVENSEQYDEQLQKTFLFFHNPLWVQQLLSDTGNANIIRVEREDEIKEISKAGEERTELIQEKNDEEKVEEPQLFKGSFTAPLTVFQNQEETAINTDVTETVDQEEVRKDEPILEIPAFKPHSADPAKEELLFEPYHTVDYFASQGIKVREDEKPKDKFTQQLRSFTDWLKAMKKLPVTEITAKVEPAAEQKVEQLAEHSIQDREVLTEAMAEVWEKQGNKAKAIEIYNKLSLLDPSKSAYFAAKIEDLKKIN